MRNATSFLVFGATSLVLTVVACGGGGSGTRPDETTGGTNSTSAGTNNGQSGGGIVPGAGNSSGGNTSAGGAATCAMTPGSKKGDGTNLVIDDIDDTDTMFAPAGTGAGSWDFGKDTTAAGTITPVGTTALMPTDGGQAGSALHVTGTGIMGWGAALAAFLNGPMGAFDASDYGGVAFYIKGTATTQDGANKIMVLARIPDVLPGAGSCCDASAMPVAGKECYSAHRAVIEVPADWKEVKLAWADFKSPTWGLGSTMTLPPNRIRDFTFSFNHDGAMTTGDGTSFDIWIDGIRFLSKDEMGNVGPGGGGGSSNGGSSSGGSSGSGNEGGAQ